MRAVRIHRFGPPEVVVLDDILVPSPGAGEVLVRVMAAGVAPWDALIREGGSKVAPQPPLTLGSDLSGIIEAVGPGVTSRRVGEEVYGVTNPQFCGAQADFAIASAGMIAPKPSNLSHQEAASAPVVAVTAWQMLFEYGQVRSGQTVLVLGAAGSVGAYLVQFALDAAARTLALARPDDHRYLEQLGVREIFDPGSLNAETHLPLVDLLLDTVGGSTLQGLLPHLNPGGKVVSVVSTDALPPESGVERIFFYADITTARLGTLTQAFETGKIRPHVGSVLDLTDARDAHHMLAGAPHKKGKIILRVGGDPA
jgi:NADPH:quinone reductase-like Zn-dependent oxidoreductase